MENLLYQEVTEEFQKHMITQLQENSRKGDRAGWLSCTPMQLVLEIYYHTGKLQEAVKNNDSELIKEYSADVANMSMMVLDSCGYLLPKGDIETIETQNTKWIKSITEQ